MAQAGAFAAQPPSCARALAELDAEVDAVIEKRRAGAPAASGPPAHVLALQRAAARACLGVIDPSPPAARVQPPIAAPTVAVQLPSPAFSQRVDHPGSPPPHRALLTITGCDALGCWASDGTRLQLQGQQLLGPRGFCSQVGTVLNCP